MNSKTILVLLVSIGYLLGANWLYSTTHESECCPAEAATTIIKKERGPLMFNWSNPTTLISDKKFPGFKANILSGMNETEGNILEITGRYFEGETAPSDFANMGLARAEAIYNERFKAEVPKNRVLFKAEKISETEGVRTEEFASAAFNWLAAAKEAPKVIETANSALIYFDFNATKKKVNPTVDDYLKRVSERLQANPAERVSITGHTDNIGNDDRNLALGERRAKMVRDILIRYGVDASRISTFSKGESAPVETNDTDRGRAANRRAEVQIIK